MTPHRLVRPTSLVTHQGQQTLLNLLPQGIMLLDTKTCIQYMNPSFETWFGIKTAQVHNIRLDVAFADPKFECAHSSVLKALEGITTLRQYCLQVPGQPKRILGLRYEPIRAENLPDITGVLIIGEDITEVTELRLNLDRAEQELERFSHVASHNLKTPLRNISIYTGLLDRRLPDNLRIELAEYIQEINRNCHKTYELVESILELSLLRNHQISLESIDCQGLLKDIIPEIEDIYPTDQITITASNLPEIVADKTLLKIVFHQLIDNGVKFNQSTQKHIHIEAHTHADRHEFSVADNGIGIEEAYKDQLFVLFHKLQPDYHYAGSGTGLAICKQLIDLHNGDIWLESSNDMTRIHFTIPSL